ncbi:hypothetical protein ACJMK2_040335 [Sinanodonta woodiana]|uniref:Peptidase M12B domain-containing protein n=1 Tax=Sinanodonta woodiana TaxID=1069815 RepID=A0ABD3WI38_SINWO
MVGFLWIVLLSIDLGSLGILANENQFYYQDLPIPDSAYRYKNKQKRESSIFYKVEAVIMIDFSLYLRLRNIFNEYIPLYDIGEAINNLYWPLINEVNDRFSQLGDSEFMIRIALTTIYYANSLEISQWRSTIQHTSEISATKALDELNSFLQTGSVTVTKNTTVIALTALKLLDNSNRAVQGISQYGSICNGTNIIILQETFDCILATVVTHYIARSMGALEDGKENNCSADDHFIMSTPNMAITGETKSNPWRFSECSKGEIKTFISSLSNVCFTRLTSATNVYKDTPGTSFTVDQQCKIIKGTPSYMCRVPLGGKYEDMCTGMYCYNATSKMCELVVPREDTLCGDGKWCIHGVCSLSYVAPSAIAECVHGDQPVLEFSTTDCNSYISIAPSECYKENVSLACCNTCSTYASGTEGCLYGNRIATCSIRQRDCYNVSINRDCCKTCSFYETTFTDCKYGDRVAWCSSISAWDCYDENINRNCCSTCKTFINSSQANCEYGDRVAWCKSITSRDCYDATTNRECCRSCDLYNTYTPNCEYGNRIPVCSLSAGDCYDSRINTACCKTCQDYHTLAQRWVAPVVGTIVGVIIVAVGVTSVLCFLRRRQRLKKTQQLQQQQQLKDVTSNRPYVISTCDYQRNRPPMNPPRDSQESEVSLDGDAEETYTYIHPNDKKDASGTVANTSVKYCIGHSTNRNANEYVEPVRLKQYSTSYGYEVTESSGTETDDGYLHIGSVVDATYLN